MKTFLSADRRFLNPQAMENVELKAAVPAKDTENNPLFTQDMPWEIRIDNGYPNVIYDRREQIFTAIIHYLQRIKIQKALLCRSVHREITDREWIV